MCAMRLTRHEIIQVVEFMREASGNDLAEKESFVGSKISMLCMQLGYRHFYELWDAVKGSTMASAKVRQQVIDALTTNYTYFYRESSHFSQLAALIASGDVPAGHGPLRAWSAGCASGEEAFNIAMVLEDARCAGLLDGHYRVVGSDISSKAVAAADKARYDFADVARMPPHWRSRYLRRSGHEYDVEKSLRDHVEFRLENVLAARPDAPFDVVMCRNMIIYLDDDAVRRFCSSLRGRMKPGGYLFLGHTEILGEIPGFTYLEPSIWRRDCDGAVWH